MSLNFGIEVILISFQCVVYICILLASIPLQYSWGNSVAKIEESLDDGDIDQEDSWDSDDDWDSEDDDWDSNNGWDTRVDSDEVGGCTSPCSDQKELGYQLAYGLNENGLTRNRPYLFYRANYKPSCNGNISFIGEGSLRGWYDFSTYDNDIEIRSLYGDWKADLWSLKIGYQEIAWGETFGVYIMDIVNPRDLTDPFFNELAWIRLPVFSFNLQLYRDPWHWQFIVSPVPRNNWFPAEGSAFDVLSKPPLVTLRGPSGFGLGGGGNDLEFGGRLGYLFESGLDLTFYYYRHWNRDPVYRLGVAVDHFYFKPVLRRMHSVGASFTKAGEETVFRGDTIFHVQTPWPDKVVGQWKKRDVWRTILGVDRQFENDLTIGIQYHFDKWEGEQLHYLSTQLTYDFCGGEMSFEIFVFKGLNSHDLWVQPLVNWYINETTTAQLRVDILDGKSKYGTFDEGFIGPFSCKDRIFLWITKAY